MSNSRKRKRSGKSGGSNIISSAALTVIAVLLLIFVIFYIKNNSFLPGALFSQTKESTEEESTETSEDKSDEREGLTNLEDGKLVYILNDKELSDYSDENVINADGYSLLASSWLEDGEDLYYFGDDGYAVSEYSEAAMDYSFDRDHVLSKIEYNDRYVSHEDAASGDYAGAVQTKTLWAFPDEDKTAAGLYAIKYKKTTESFSHQLGGDTQPQYTSKYAIAIADGYIYYAAFTDASDKMLEPIANKLFRMKPGAEEREIAAEDVRGYKIIEAADGRPHVYYYDGSRVKRASHFEKDESLKIFPEDGSYYVDISSGKAVLMLEGGYPVTLASDSFKAGNFVYALSADGEISKVASKDKVVYGGYTYTAENGEAFGSKKARIIREANGVKEVISSEFDGSVGNLHFDFDSSKIIAEYVDASGSAGLISISLDGDVDAIYDAFDLGSKCVLYAVQDGYAIFEAASGFKKARISSSYPIAAGVDPISIGETESTAENAESSVSGSSESTQGGNTETAAVPEESAASDREPDGVINEHKAEKKGPGTA